MNRRKSLTQRQIYFLKNGRFTHRNLVFWIQSREIQERPAGRSFLLYQPFMARATTETSEIIVSEPRVFTSPELEGHLGEEIRKHAARIVTGLIQKAVEGGAVQAKFLFDFAGLSASPPPEEKGESLLELMRRELELEEPPEGTVE